MARNAVKAKLDIIFKKIFTDKNNEDLLTDFIAYMIDIPVKSIKEIVIQNTEILPLYSENKFSILDLKMKVNDKIVNVELQIKEEVDFRDRALFYWSKLYSGELKSGEDYGNIPETISINILNFNLFDCKEYQSSFTMMEKTRHEVLTEKCKIHFFELKKINKKVNKKDRKSLWLQFINAEEEEEFQMLEKTEIPIMKKAIMVIKEMSADEKLQEMARMREKTLHDEASAIVFAKRKGLEEGMQKGMEKGMEKGIEKGMVEEKIKICKQMLKHALPINDISKITGLSLEEINKLDIK